MVIDGNLFFKYASIRSLDSNEIIKALRATYNGGVYHGRRYTLYPSDYYMVQEVADEVTYQAFDEYKEGELVQFRR